MTQKTYSKNHYFSMIEYSKRKKQQPFYQLPAANIFFENILSDNFAKSKVLL